MYHFIPLPTGEGLGERPMNFKEGEVLYFNKPLGWTSFKVVGHARYHICRRIKEKKLKVGHAGTLDPLATGVMIVCTGKATKRIEEFQYHTVPGSAVLSSLISSFRSVLRLSTWLKMVQRSVLL